ncbi:MAG: hypothetical protein ABIP79_07015 [Chitinophagaceae bacterium]
MKTISKKEPHYLTDKKGKKLSVVISIDEYEKMLDELEELDDIRMYDDVKAKKEKSIPLTQYLQRRKKKNA